MITLFRTNRPAVYFLLLLYAIVMRGAALVHPFWIPASPDALLGPATENVIHRYHIPLIALQGLDILFIYLQAMVLNFTFTYNGIFDRKTFVPALIFITLSSLLGPWVGADLQTVAQFFLLISFFSLFTLTGQEISRENIFYTSLFLSFGSLFYFPVAFFLILLIPVLFIRGYSILDILLLLMGFVLPYYFIGIAYYYENRLPEYLDFVRQIIIIEPLTLPDMNYGEMAFVAYAVLLALAGYAAMRADRELLIVKQRRLAFTLLAYLGLVIVAAPFVNGSKMIYFQMLVLPCTVFIAKLFDRRRLRIFHYLAFAVLALGALFMQLYYLKIV
jgi:hypothetical protein